MKVIGRKKLYERIVHNLMINNINKDTSEIIKTKKEINSYKKWEIVSIPPKEPPTREELSHISEELYKIFAKHF